MRLCGGSSHVPAGAGASGWFMYIVRDIGIQNLAIGSSMDGMHLAWAQPISTPAGRRKGEMFVFSGAQVGGKDTLTRVPKLRADAHPPPLPRRGSPAAYEKSTVCPCYFERRFPCSAQLGLRITARTAWSFASSAFALLSLLCTLPLPTLPPPPAQLPAQLRRELPEGLTLTPWRRKAMPPAPTSRPTPCAGGTSPMAKARPPWSRRRPRRRSSRR